MPHQKLLEYYHICLDGVQICGETVINSSGISEVMRLPSTLTCKPDVLNLSFSYILFVVSFAVPCFGTDVCLLFDMLL